MQRKLAVIFGTVIIVTGLAVFFSRSQRRENRKPLAATVTIYPWAAMTKLIVGDEWRVETVVPAGMEPHEFEPKPKDVGLLQEAPVVVFNGAGLDDWAGKSATGKAVKVEVAKIVKEKTDPHFWLDPEKASQAVEAIEAAISTALPGEAETYSTNTKALRAKLAVLDKEYQAGLNNCRLRTIIVSHQAFDYVAKRYNFQAEYISGITPEAEPSPQKLAELTSLVKKYHVQYIFTETLASMKLAETLAKETGTQTLVLNPIEGLTAEQEQAGEDYFSLMRENLRNLQLAMQCK